MANEFKIKNGYLSEGNSQITGSLDVSAGITGSLFGTASFATTALSASYFSGSISNAISASFATTALSASYFSGSISNAISASYALTASYYEGSVLSASYAATASYVGPTLTQDLTLNGNLTVNGTASYTYITASQFDVGTNTISVNVAEPAERFGGLLVYDSGSLSHEATASLLWDSLNNHWIYQNASGSTYSGGMLMSGPRNTGSLGDEPSLTRWFIARSDGGDHLNNTQIYSSASIHIVTGSLTVTEGITGSLLGTASYATQALSASWAPGGGSAFPYTGSALITGSLGVTGSFTTRINNNTFGGNAIFENVNTGSSALSSIALKNASQNGVSIFQQNSNGDLGFYNSATTGKINFFTNSTTRMTIDDTGNVGIGTSGPSYPLDVYATQMKVGDGSGVSSIYFDSGPQISNNSISGWFKSGNVYSNTLGSGYVGVGTSTPGHMFNIYSNSSNPPSVIGTSTDPTAPMYVGHGYDAVTPSSTPNNITSKVRFMPSGDAGFYADDITFDTSPQTTLPSSTDSSVERMRITKDGNVGIGTSTPLSTLDVQGTGRFTGDLEITGSLYTTSSAVTVASFAGNQNGYIEFSVKNNSTGISASGDIAVYANNGNATSNYIDMGINGSGHTGASYDGIYLGKANDGYLFNDGGNLYIGNANNTSPSRSLFLFSHPNGGATGLGVTITGSQVAINKTGSINGIFDISGSTVITGSLRGQVSTLSISSNTASINMSSNNFFTLALVNGANTHINPTNMQPGQTVNIRVTQGSLGTGTVSFPSFVDQPSGSAYTGTAIANAIDIVTMITFDSTTVFLSSVRNMI